MDPQNNINQTQVLNLEEVEQVSKQEKKKKSKVLPVVVLLSAVFLIGVGVFLQLNLGGDDYIPTPGDDYDNIENDYSENNNLTLLACNKDIVEDDHYITYQNEFIFSDDQLIEINIRQTHQANEDRLDRVYLYLQDIREEVSNTEGIMIFIERNEGVITLVVVIDMVNFDMELLPDYFASVEGLSYLDTSEYVRGQKEIEGFVCE